MSDFNPFENEADVMTLAGEFTLENRLERIALYGSLDLTRDQRGLALALKLKEVIDATVAKLQAEALPDLLQSDDTGLEEIVNPDL